MTLMSTRAVDTKVTYLVAQVQREIRHLIRVFDSSPEFEQMLVPKRSEDKSESTATGGILQNTSAQAQAFGT